MGYLNIALALTYVISQIIVFCIPLFKPLKTLLWIILFPIFLYFSKRNRNNRIRGVVTPTGLKINNHDTEIAFDVVENITGAQGLQKISTDNTSVDIYLSKQEIVKLSQTRLNNWTIHNYAINILPATLSKSLTITYLSVGKYTFNLLAVLYILVAINILFIRSRYGILMLVLGIGIYFYLQKHPPITVEIEP